MAYNVEAGNADLRAKFFDKTIKNLAPRMYKFMQALSEDSTSAWKNYFWREESTVLTAGGAHPTIRGLAPGAQFAQARQRMEQITSVIEKYGLEQQIVWEDILTNDVDIQERALFKLAEGVTKAVDDQIYSVLSDNDVSTSILVYNIGGLAGMPAGQGGGWNQSSSAFIDDLFAGTQLIAENNIDTSDLILFLNPRDMRSAKRYIVDKGAQFQSFGDEVARNGRMGKVAGVTLVESNSVPVSRALLVKPKTCGTWKNLVPLQTTTIEDKFRNVTIRVVQEGVCQLYQPKAVVLFKGTNITS